MIHMPSIFLILNVLHLIHCEMEPNIVSGLYAKITKFPHSVYLNVFCVDASGLVVTWICGASILTDKILLTAAHCLEGCNSRSLVNANVGHEHKDRGAVSSMYNYILHEEFDSENTENDIALVRVKTPLIFGQKVKRVALMRKPPYSEKAQIAGWGAIDEINDKTENLLKFITQYVLSTEDCLKIVEELPLGVICASSGDENSYSSRVHEAFDPYVTLINDIAVAKLANKLMLGMTIKRIAIMNDPPYSEPARIAGWGLIDEKNKIASKFLAFIYQRVWDQTKCEEYLKSLPNGTFCAASNNKHAYPSGGDSGSALVVRGYIQIGIVSYKMPQISKSLVVYTDTGYFYDWIIKNTIRLYCVDVDLQ